MKPQQKNKIKALFLLIVFSLNTVVGFACSVGVDMGYNTKHHSHISASEAVAHVHKSGKKHVHHGKKKSHSHSKAHKHSHGKSHHHGENSHQHKSDSDKDNCCNDTVKKFQELDKSVPNSFNLVHPVFLTAFVATYYNISLLPYTNVVKDVKPFVRSYHPPISDIRIAIRSFLI